jgi:hypothetical protein
MQYILLPLVFFVFTVYGQEPAYGHTKKEELQNSDSIKKASKDTIVKDTIPRLMYKSNIRTNSSTNSKLVGEPKPALMGRKQE